MAKYRFDGSQGISGTQVEEFLSTTFPNTLFPGSIELGTLDAWNRGVIELSGEQAAELARLTENTDIVCVPADGTEETTRLNAGTYKATDSWQW